jgi:methanol metabolism-related c-type cytochrome
MAIRFISWRISLTVAFIAGTAAGNSFAITDSQGDYKDFAFTAEQPYFVQNGKVDFGTYNGFRRYHSECHVCHGPAGLGSSYAPALMKSMEVLTFQQFVDVIVRGREGQQNSVMPGFANNLNVLPYLNDLYAYLKARSDGAIPTAARPAKFPKKKPADNQK